MGLPVISIAQMRQWEQATWAAGQTEDEVIRRVGGCVAGRALQLTRPWDMVLILAGKGHNGEDARCARGHLTERRVELLDVREPAAELAKLDALLSLRPALVIDGLFGIGLNRPLAPEWVRFIERLNQSRAQVLAVDVPSGLNGDSGEPQGAAVRAALTLTVGAPKAGLLRPAAWPFVGRLEVAADVGLAPCPEKGELAWTLPEDFRDFPPRREAATHKGTYGYLAIVAGSMGFHGAAVLAALGAQRAQPGLITLHALEAVYQPIAAQLRAVMVSPWRHDTELPGKYSAILAGPGLASADVPDELKVVVARLWREAAQPVVVDASGLAWLQEGAVPKNAVRVVTPHPGEAARLLGTTTQEVQADRPRALREISRRFGDAWVVLKGNQTLVGRNTGELAVNSSGNPHLAQGGSGDLLGGFLTGLLAQTALAGEPFKAICYAVWEHGAAADRLQAVRSNWVIEDLAEALGGAGR